MIKGIVLAGGSGSRLYPITKAISKQLVPIYNKPMIFYPISVLMLAGIKDILIITTPQDQHNYKELLGDGSEYGVNFEYKIQDSPDGLAQAFILGRDFIGDDRVCLILGDNIFYGYGLSELLKQSVARESGATIFGYHVSDPKRFGVVEFNNKGGVISIEEKPQSPKSNYAVTGLYIYDNDVVKIAQKIKPSSRGELEITDINNRYLEQGKLNVEILGRGIAWLDTGTHESLMEASQFVQAIETSQGLKVACLEEIAFNKGWLTKEKLLSKALEMKNNEYGKYLHKLSEL